MRTARPPLAAFLAALLLSASAAADPAAVSAGWQHLANFAAKNAAPAFDRAPDSSEARLGRALALIAAQPRTRANLDRAEAELAKLAAPPASDPVAVAAAFHLARLLHHHPFEPAPDRALPLYASLVAGHLDTPHGEQAALAWSVHRLYSAPAAPADQSAAFEEIHALLARVPSPAARANLALVLAEAEVRLRSGHAAALELYSGIISSDTLRRASLRARVLLQAADAATRRARPDLAAAHYRRFLAEHPRDPRAHEVSRLLAALTSVPDPAPRP